MKQQQQQKGNNNKPVVWFYQQQQTAIIHLWYYSIHESRCKPNLNSMKFSMYIMIESLN